MEVHSDDVVNASDAEEIREEFRRDDTSMCLLLGLARIWEVAVQDSAIGARSSIWHSRHDSYRRQSREPNQRVDVPVIDFADPPLHAEIMMSISMILSLILELPLCKMNTS